MDERVSSKVGVYHHWHSILQWQALSVTPQQGPNCALALYSCYSRATTGRNPLYDFVFSVRDLRWPGDPSFQVKLIAKDARQAWRKFEEAYPYDRFDAHTLRHNMYNTSSLCK